MKPRLLAACRWAAWGTWCAAWMAGMVLTAGVTPQIVTDWGSGAQVKMTVTNDTGQAVPNWRLKFTYPGTISTLLNAERVGQTGDTYEVKGMPGSENLAPGSSTVFGFIADRGGLEPKDFRPFVLESGEAGSSGATHSQSGHPAPPLLVRNSVRSGQAVITLDPLVPEGDAYRGRIQIVNLGHPLADWSFSFRLPGKLLSTTNAKFTDLGNGNYRLTPDPESLRLRRLSPGERVRIPFLATIERKTGSMSRIQFKGISAHDSPIWLKPENGATGGANPPTVPEPESPPEETKEPEPETKPEPDAQPKPDPKPPATPKMPKAPWEKEEAEEPKEETPALPPPPNEPVQSVAQDHPGPPITGPKIVGFFADYFPYGQRYGVEKIPAQKLNVINYAFAGYGSARTHLPADSPFQKGKITVRNGADSVHDPEAKKRYRTFEENVKKLEMLKEEHPHLKTMLSIRSAHFSFASFSESRREEFAELTVEFMRDHGFDGLDLCVTNPGPEYNRVHKMERPEDKPNFTLLCQEVRRQLDESAAEDGTTYYLSMTAWGMPEEIERFELEKVAESCDWINIAAFEMYRGRRFDAVDHISALKSFTDLSVDRSIQTYLEAGVAPKKLVLGMPFYGRGFAGSGVNAISNTPQTHIYAAPSAINEGSVFEYWDIVQRESQEGYTKFWNSPEQTPTLEHPELDRGTWISYEDPMSVRCKVDYIKTTGLGGAMFWELSSDVQGGGPLSLLGTLHQALIKEGPWPAVAQEKR